MGLAEGDEGERERGDSELSRIAVRDGPVPVAALDAPREGREYAADSGAEGVHVGRGRRRGGHDHAGRRERQLEECGGGGVGEDAAGKVGA